MALLLASAVAGCASTPQASLVGQTFEEVAQQQRSFSVELQLVDQGQAFAVGTVVMPVTLEAVSLVFIDGHLACSAYGLPEGFDWRWVAQADGLDYLADLLRNACGRGDEVSPRVLPTVATPRPAVPPEVNSKVPQARTPGDNSFVEGAGTVGLVILSPVIVAVGLPTLAVDAMIAHSGEGSRAGVVPGMSRAEAESILGRPATVLELPGSRATVLAYPASLTRSRSWYAGIRDGQVIWTHVSDGWLDRMAEQAIAKEKQTKKKE